MTHLFCFWSFGLKLSILARHLVSCFLRCENTGTEVPTESDPAAQSLAAVTQTRCLFHESPSAFPPHVGLIRNWEIRRCDWAAIPGLGISQADCRIPQSWREDALNVLHLLYSRFRPGSLGVCSLALLKGKTSRIWESGRRASGTGATDEPVSRR